MRLSEEGHSPKQKVGGGDLLINNNKLEGSFKLRNLHFLLSWNGTEGYIAKGTTSRIKCFCQRNCIKLFSSTPTWASATSTTIERSSFSQGPNKFPKHYLAIYWQCQEMNGLGLGKVCKTNAFFQATEVLSRQIPRVCQYFRVRILTTAKVGRKLGNNRSIIIYLKNFHL